jgi:hypothetical protein
LPNDAFSNSVLHELKKMLQFKLPVQPLQVEVFEGRCKCPGTSRRLEELLGVKVD